MRASSNDPQFKIRLPSDLKAWLEEEAARTSRSVTSEIVYLLQEARHHYGDAKGNAPAGGTAEASKHQ